MPRSNSTASRIGRTRPTVSYVLPRGRVVDATVTGGSGDTLNLRVPSLKGADRVKTGIAKRTSQTQTNVWF